MQERFIERLKNESYQQKFSFSCGPMSMVLALARLGINVEEEDMVVEMKTTRFGTAWEDLFDVANRRDLKTKLVGRATYGQLLRDFPKGAIIVSWMWDLDGGEEGHFSVVSAIEKDLIEIADPADGEIKLFTREEWLAKWRDAEGIKTYLLIERPK